MNAWDTHRQRVSKLTLLGGIKKGRDTGGPEIRISASRMQESPPPRLPDVRK